MWVSSVEPITITRDGSMALRMLMGIPIQPIRPKAHTRLRAEVSRGIAAASPLRMKSRMVTTSTTAERGASRVRSSNSAAFSSASMRGEPTWKIWSKLGLYTATICSSVWLTRCS